MATETRRDSKGQVLVELLVIAAIFIAVLKFFFIDGISDRALAELAKTRFQAQGVSK